METKNTINENIKTPNEKCLVILSGGQDSTICLALAKQHFKETHAITFSYGQKHSLEINSAKKVASLLKIDSHEILELPTNTFIGTSPLIDPTQKLDLYKDISTLPKRIENTYVPGRNLLFLTIAANRAFVLGIYDIFLGVCQVDSGGYPDTTEDFIRRVEVCLQIGVFGNYPTELLNSIRNKKSLLKLHTPLLNLGKEEIVLLAKKLDCIDLLQYTTTCYEGTFPPCRKCHACCLREKGFTKAGIKDPLLKYLSK